MSDAQHVNISADAVEEMAASLEAADLVDAPSDTLVAATLRALRDQLSDMQKERDEAHKWGDARTAAEREAKQKLERLAWEHAALLSKKSRMEYHINEALNQLRFSDSYAKEDRTHPRMPTTWEIQNGHVRDDLNNALNGI